MRSKLPFLLGAKIFLSGLPGALFQHILPTHGSISRG